MRRKLAPACRQSAIVIAVGAVNQRGGGRARRRVVDIKRGLRRIVAGVEETVADAEMEPDAARGVTVAPGFDRNAEHLGRAADWQRACLDLAGQTLRHDLGGIDRRIAEPGEKRETANVILMAVAQN